MIRGLALVVIPFSPTLSLVIVNQNSLLLNGGKLMLCKRCALNGNRRDGGGLGVCKIHSKTRCRFFGCETKTLGEELCAAHTHQVELARWKGKAELRVFDPRAEIDLAEIRQEKLLNAKFLAHQAVEEFFRSLLHVSQALYGEPTQENEEQKAA